MNSSRPRIALALIALASLARGQSVAPLFSEQQYGGSSNSGFGIQKADFNGDGVIDVAYAVLAPDIQFNFGDGQGSFGPPSWIFTGIGENAGSFAVGDLDGNSRPDIVVSSLGMQPNIPGLVEVFLNTGTGTFGTPSPIPITGLPSSVVLGDWSEDGLLDLVVCTYVSTLGATVMRTFIGDGAGHFTAASTPTIAGHAFEIALARIDGDAHLDLVALGFAPRQIAVFAGLGAAGFAAPVLRPISVDAQNLAIADANGDGWNDVLAAESGAGGHVVLSYNNGAGGLLADVKIAVDPQTNAVTCEDLDADGVADLAVAVKGINAVPGGVYLLRGLGAGAFAAPVRLHAGHGAMGIVVHDLDGDGGRDLLVANSWNAGFTALRATGPGAYSTTTTIGCPPYPEAVVLGDLDLNGKLDMVVAHGGVSVYRGNGAGGFGAPTAYVTGAVEKSLALGDLDADGKLDLVTADSAGSSAKVLLNNGTGAFLAAASYTTGPGPWDVALADFDRDGALDLVTANSLSNTVSFLRGNGAGGFDAWIPYVATGNPRSLAVADFDSDGWPDLAVGTNTANQVAILRGSSGGVFGSPTLIPVGSHQDELAARDVNGDGFPDLLVSANNLLLLLGDGNGGFGPPTTIAGMPPPHELQIADIDGDGDADIVGTADTLGLSLWVALNDGAGGFALVEHFGTDREPNSLALGDLDGDDRLDAVTANKFSSDLSVLLSRRPYTSLVYCDAKTTSQGCTPEIHFSGAASATASGGFVVRCTDVVNNKPGLLLYGVNGRAALPFQAGVQCVATPIRRSVPVGSGGHAPPNDCSGMFALDMNAFARGTLGGSPLAALSVPGTKVDGQWWGRDPGFAPPNGSMLSDALEYLVGP